jgi:hypothetical protein
VSEQFKDISDKSIISTNSQNLSKHLLNLSKFFLLSWSHYIRLLSVKKLEARKFYETEALQGGWSVRQLDRQISTLFYERTALSKNKATILKKRNNSKTGRQYQPGRSN